jgi:hypothetical protein
MVFSPLRVDAVKAAMSDLRRAGRRPVEATPDRDGVLRPPATAPADEHG